jgi:hypothetical protein
LPRQARDANLSVRKPQRKDGGCGGVFSSFSAGTYSQEIVNMMTDIIEQQRETDRGVKGYRHVS